MTATPPTDLFRQVEAVLGAHDLNWYTDNDVYCHNCGRIEPDQARYHGEQALWEAGLLRDQPPAGYFDDTEDAS